MFYNRMPSRIEEGAVAMRSISTRRVKTEHRTSRVTLTRRTFLIKCFS